MIDYFFSVVEVKNCENGVIGDIIIFFFEIVKKNCWQFFYIFYFKYFIFCYGYISFISYYDIVVLEYGR